MKTPMTWKKQLATIVVVAVIAVYQYFQNNQTASLPQNEQHNGTSDIRQIEDWRSGQWVQLDATVSRLLSDDNEGSRHQRFIIKPGGKQTLLVAHNIDLARRIPIRKGDTISLRGRYEPNNRGGVVHWTHHDPRGGPGGWIEYNGKRYE